MSMTRKTPYEPPQRMGQDRFIIWSMSYDWEPEGDPNGGPVNYERANDFGEYATLAEAEVALAALTWRDENWHPDHMPDPGAQVVFWIWRETPIAQRMVIVPDEKPALIAGGDDAYAFPLQPDEEAS